MSNLQSAKSAIQAELAHMREGMAYYQSRVEALEQTLTQLEDVIASSNKAKAQAGRKPRRGTMKDRIGREAIGAETHTAELPHTGGDFWTSIVTDQPQSAPDILRAAIAKLGFSPAKDQVKKLAARMTSALNTLVKSEKIQSSGSGRKRRFFKS